MTVIGCVYCPPDVRFTHERLMLFDGYSACENCVAMIAQAMRDEVNKKMQETADAAEEASDGERSSYG